MGLLDLHNCKQNEEPIRGKVDRTVHSTLQNTHKKNPNPPASIFSSSKLRLLLLQSSHTHTPHQNRKWWALSLSSSLPHPYASVYLLIVYSQYDLVLFFFDLILFFVFVLGSLSRGTLRSEGWLSSTTARTMGSLLSSSTSLTRTGYLLLPLSFIKVLLFCLLL